MSVFNHERRREREAYGGEEIWVGGMHVQRYLTDCMCPVHHAPYITILFTEVDHPLPWKMCARDGDNGIDDSNDFPGRVRLGGESRKMRFKGGEDSFWSGREG